MLPQHCCVQLAASAAVFFTQLHVIIFEHDEIKCKNYIDFPANSHIFKCLKSLNSHPDTLCLSYIMTNHIIHPLIACVTDKIVICEKKMESFRNTRKTPIKRVTSFLHVTRSG